MEDRNQGDLGQTIFDLDTPDEYKELARRFFEETGIRVLLIRKIAVKHAYLAALDSVEQLQEATQAYVKEGKEAIQDKMVGERQYMTWLFVVREGAGKLSEWLRRNGFADAIDLDDQACLLEFKTGPVPSMN